MTKRTRHVLVVSGLVTAIGLGTGLVAYYNAARAVGPAEFAYVPADAAAVAFADVRKIMASEFRQHLRATLPTDAEQHRLLAETGVDIEKDIDVAVVAISPDAERQGSVAFLRGRFDAARIDAKAAEHGAVTEDYAGKRLLTYALEKAAVTFLEPDLLAVGHVAALKRAIDTSSSHQDVTTNTDLIALVEGLDPQADVWMVGRYDAVAGDWSRRRVHALPNIEWLTVSASVTDGVSGVVRAETADDANGEQLRALVNGMLAAARVMVRREPAMEAAFNSFRVAGTGKTAELSFTVSPEVFRLVHGMASHGPFMPGR